MDKIEELKKKIYAGLCFGSPDVATTQAIMNELAAILDAQGKPEATPKLAEGGKWEASRLALMFDGEVHFLLADDGDEIASLLNSQGAEIKRLRGDDKWHIRTEEKIMAGCERQPSELLKEIGDRLNYQFLQIDGTYNIDFSNPMLGDTVMMVLRLVRKGLPLQAELTAAQERVEELEGQNKKYLLQLGSVSQEKERLYKIVSDKTATGGEIIPALRCDREIALLENNSLTSEVAKLQEALGFYADKQNQNIVGVYGEGIYQSSHDPCVWVPDNGKIARQALSGSDNSEGES